MGAMTAESATVRSARDGGRRRAWTRRVVTGSVVTVATLTVLGALSTTVMTITGRFLYAVGETDPRRSLNDLPQMYRADLRDGATGTLADLDLGMRLLGALPSLVHAITVAVAAWLLLRALRGISDGAPFSPRVLSSWTRLSVVLLVGGIVEAVADTVAVLYLTTRVGLLWGADRYTREQEEAFLGADYSGINIAAPSWPISILVAGLVALALTTAFRAGARLEEDVDGVV